MPKLPHGWSRPPGATLNIPPGSTYGAELGKRVQAAEAIRKLMADDATQVEIETMSRSDAARSETQDAVAKAVRNCEEAAASCSNPEEAQLWALKAQIIGSSHSTAAVKEYFHLLEKRRKKQVLSSPKEKPGIRIAQVVGGFVFLILLLPFDIGIICTVVDGSFTKTPLAQAMPGSIIIYLLLLGGNIVAIRAILMGFTGRNPL